ncbi:probable vacuolar ATP synthase subunit F [Cephalotrichum gorgonifer]|uniref:V-type proton ATPase subunit F n=1 Tax=Cephalotrichum gorgonifer TaxID=2041049 RepID=A0AAE8SYK2_9PEZI|nr:probable vacuolar ATP synthase subunit F [Cephalotrichum gorgonifer]
MAGLADFKDREFIAVIGDEASPHPRRIPHRPSPISHRPDSVTGLLLAGIGHVTTSPKAQRNFLVVDAKTETATIEEAFEEFTKKRKDIGIVLINQHVANRIRHQLESHKAAFPSVIEIPSKDHPYDPAKDSLMARVEALMGMGGR